MIRAGAAKDVMSRRAAAVIHSLSAPHVEGGEFPRLIRLPHQAWTGGVRMIDARRGGMAFANDHLEAERIAPVT
jgi:hypothetical protein